MRIAVLSDTHGRLPTSIVEAVRGADELWHLGDVVGEEIVELLRPLTARFRIVRGNCDACLDWPPVERFELFGVRYHLEHIPPYLPPRGVDVVLHGHTHVPRDERIAGVRFLNPGTAGGPTKGAPPSYAWLTIEEGSAPMWKIVRL